MISNNNYKSASFNGYANKWEWGKASKLSKTSTRDDEKKVTEVANLITAQPSQYKIVEDSYGKELQVKGLNKDFSVTLISDNVLSIKEERGAKSATFFSIILYNNSSKIINDFVKLLKSVNL